MKLFANNQVGLSEVLKFIFLYFYVIQDSVIISLHLKESQTNLTLKWSRPSALPLVVKGGSLWTLTQKSTFPNEFGGEMRATDKVIQKSQNTTKISKIEIKITKWRPKKQFLSRDIKFSTKNGKTTFPKEFSLEIWLIIEDCKYNYTAEINFGKSYSVALLWGKQILSSAQNMLIYAN